MFSRTATAVTLSALFAVASAQFKVLTPGGPDVWWVAKSSNVMSWNCQDPSAPSSFTIVIANPDKSLLPDRMPIVSIEQNADCSKIITQDQANQPPGTGYTIQLADILNVTHILAESQPFEIKPLGSAYPATASPSATGGSGSSAGSTTASAAGSSNTNAATKNIAGVGAALMGALFGLVL